MRTPGLIPNVAKEVQAFQHRDVIEECRLRREAWERRFSLPESACPYGCDGSGRLEIAFHEYAPWEAIPDPLLEIVYPHGLILTPCECAAQ